ncbi:MAG TPA: haloacid dehalogenase-like hydrolase [Candidatus Thermoplasmatota archaeon]|nr:haloacid dehalogenase-like hydrolase [Candidatus Thermoplasmatota archaeon]
MSGGPAGAGGPGRFDLVTLDLDGTLIPDDTAFAAILRETGFAKEAEETDGAYFAGRMSLEDCFWAQWRLIQPRTLADLHRSLRKATWLPGIAEGVARLRAAGLRVCLLTDQPSTCTDFLGRWGLTEAVCSPVAVKEGRQASIDARFDKLANLRQRLGEWGIHESRVCHVGNGVNDIPVFLAVGGSVAVFDNVQVRSAAQAWIPSPASLGDVVDAVLALHAGNTESSVKSPQTR